MERCVKMDGKVRTDHNFPAGFMDAVELDRNGDCFRLLYDTKGRFVLYRIGYEEIKFKLCRVNKVFISPNKISVLVTRDEERTIRYPDSLVKVNDTVKVDIATGKMTAFLKFELGVTCMIVRGRNAGRVGILMHVERHDGSFLIITVKDAEGHTFATRLKNAFVIGTANETLVSLPKGKGIEKSILEERDNAVKRGDL